MSDRRQTPSPKTISDRRIMIWHIAIFALAAFLDLQMGLRVPGAERVINAQIAKAHDALRESRTRRTGATDHRMRYPRNSAIASDP